ncbi:hypothetical protein C8R44DRAFT_791042 [Mycena epipterygia]|nr:hypothetical protein C8R44DRAFT_791042 [Mycena epipterygia]
MHFTSLVKFLGAALLCWVSTAHARADPITTNDLHCPKGSYTGFVHNSYAYNAPLHKFTDITKSFFHEVWYANTHVSNTTGTDNVPGATRAGYFVGHFNETLTAYLLRPDELSYTYHGRPYTFAAPNRRPIYFPRYAETLRFMSICGGRATFIDVNTYLCSDDQIAAHDVWYSTHMTTFKGLAVKVGATVLAGDCPRAWLASSSTRN